MSQTEPSSLSADASVERAVHIDDAEHVGHFRHAAEQAADAMMERRYPSDIDRLREVVGIDVLPFYRDEQAIVASQQAGERWPHLVAVANARDASASPAMSATPSAPLARAN